MGIEVFWRGDSRRMAVIEDGRIYRVWHATLFSYDVPSGYIEGRRIFTRDHDEVAHVDHGRIWSGGTLIGRVDAGGRIWVEGQQTGRVEGASTEEEAALAAAVLLRLDEFPLPIKEAQDSQATVAGRHSDTDHAASADANEVAESGSSGGSSHSAPIEPLYYAYGCLALAVTAHDPIQRGGFSGGDLIVFAAATVVLFPLLVVLSLVVSVGFYLLADKRNQDRDKQKQKVMIGVLLFASAVVLVVSTVESLGVFRVQQPTPGASLTLPQISQPASATPPESSPTPESQHPRHHARRHRHPSHSSF